MKTPTDDLIALSCKAVAEQFVGDDTVPGLVIAHLNEEKSPTGEAVWYVAARRYDKLIDERGQVIPPIVVKVYHADLDEAVRQVAEELVLPTAHMRALERAVGK